MTRGLSIAIWLVAVGGCNQYYGLDETRLPGQDASPVACPPPGRPLRFSPAIQQAVQQECSTYHFNGDGSLTTATCRSSNGYSFDIFVGRRDEPLVKMPLTVPMYTYYSSPRPSPTRSRVYVVRYSGTYALVTVDETSPGTWTDTGAISIPYSNHLPSNVFRGTTGGDRIILTNTNYNVSEMIEYEHDGTTWIMRGEPRTRPTSYSNFDAFSVTTDGLRAVYPSQDRKSMMYVERPDLDSWFGEPLPLEGAPVVTRAQLTDDCMRLYYDGLDSIFFSQQS